MTDFGPETTTTIDLLRVGDFVVEIPQQQNVRGVRVMSAIKSRRVAVQGIDRTWTASPGYRRRRYHVDSHVITFVSGGPGGLNVPADFAVVVRPKLVESEPAVDLADDAIDAGEIAPCLICSDPSCRVVDGETLCASCASELSGELPTTCYATMTVDGGHGSSFDALDDDDAIAQATRAGYDVLDVTDHAGVPTLVIAD